MVAAGKLKGGNLKRLMRQPHLPTSFGSPSSNFRFSVAPYVSFRSLPKPKTPKSMLQPASSNIGLKRTLPTNTFQRL